MIFSTVVLVSRGQNKISGNQNPMTLSYFALISIPVILCVTIYCMPAHQVCKIWDISVDVSDLKIFWSLVWNLNVFEIWTNTPVQCYVCLCNRWPCSDFISFGCPYCCIQIECPGREKEKFCDGNVPPAEMTFNDCSTLRLVFYSDTSDRRKGFMLRFVVYDPSAGWWRLSL